MIFILYMIFKIGHRVLMNMIDNEDVEDYPFFSFNTQKNSNNHEIGIHVADIFLNLMLVSLLTASIIKLLLSFTNIDSAYLMFVIAILGSLFVFYIFDFFANFLTGLIIPSSTKPYVLIYPFMLILLISYPFRKLFERSVKHEKIIKKNSLTFSELSDVIESSKAEPEEEQEKNLMKGVINFSDLEVKEIMRSRVDMLVFDSKIKFSQLLDGIIESGYSRFPIIEDSLDNIKGILHFKDILPFLKENDDFNWSKLIRPAFFAPENLKINKLLKDFQTQKYHMAVIVDEYGGTSGLVTLEDILEEIVGEIDDEFDTESDGIDFVKVSDYEFKFDGKTSLNDFCKITEYSFEKLQDIKGDAETLAGLILSIEGKFPHKDQIIPFDNMEFIVEQMDNRRIQKIKVILLDVDYNEE